MKSKFIPRDISWLSFNARVLQEANDPTVPLKHRIRFLGIFSNNLDEFFRVRVATLRRMVEFAGKKMNMHPEQNPQLILDEIQMIVLQQQNEFNRIWDGILEELNEEKIFLIDDKGLNDEQKIFVKEYFDNEVRPFIIPLMIESIPVFPYLREKSIYLGVVLQHTDSAYNQKYALIEVPQANVGRFLRLPSPSGENHIMLLEDVIRYSLPQIFSYFEYNNYISHVFKVTKDAEINIDNDISTSIVQKIEKGLKNRRKGKPVRFIYDKEMDAGLLQYLIQRLNLSRRDTIIPGGRIHNFRNFMKFPDVFQEKIQVNKPFAHPAFKDSLRVTDVVMEKDVMLHFPYHSFNPVVDLLREAAMDPDVVSIKITAYRLAEKSRIINALINAVRNGKEVTVMMELKARFDEEANLEWKELLDLEGVKVVTGVDNMKVHAKICQIKKRVANKVIHYGFVSTGNINEDTAKVYGDHLLMTHNRSIMNDIARVFKYIETPTVGLDTLKMCKVLWVSPVSMRKNIERMIDQEIKNVKAGKRGCITIKLNSLSDEMMIEKLNEAALKGVELQLIIRGIYCGRFDRKKFVHEVKHISIVDEYLEHARIILFHDNGKNRMYISSADFMVRNLDHRVEVAAPIFDPEIKKELKHILKLQFKDNVKARILDNDLKNNYVISDGEQHRSQTETYNFLKEKS